MSITLKNGSTTVDPRLTRIPFFDERSRNFPIRSVNTGKTPRSYTWRCNEWFDQGVEGACVGFALGHEAAARPSEVQGLGYKFLVEGVYHEAQKIDPWEGGSYPGAVPFYEGTSVLAGVKVMHKKGFFESYRWAFNIDDLIMGIGHNGPAVLGINWYEGMYDTDSKGFVHVSGRIMGGHAILARAVNIKKEYITLRNSWGKSWGINGDCYISFTDMDRLLREDGEAVFMLNRKTKIQI